jgi:sugar-specific transcriptional regulator TrmB
MYLFVAPLPSKAKNLNQQIGYPLQKKSSGGSFLEPQFSKLQVLIDLGLTLIQARVYLALVESGPSKISAISKISNVARPDVYSTLSKLQQLGLAEKIIKKPLEYKATPVNEGLSLLLETKTEKYKKLKAETQILLDTAKITKPNKKKQIETPQFVLIPKRTVIERIKSAIEKAQVSIDLVLSWRRFSQGIVSKFAESIEVAWAKNVKIRFIIESPSKNETAEQLIQFCREKPFCQINFIANHPRTIFGIYDKKEVFIIVISKTDLQSSSALWSKNPSLIGLAEDYFEKLWFTSMERSHQNPTQKLKK